MSSGGSNGDGRPSALTRAWRLLAPLLDWRRTFAALTGYPRYLADARRYRQLGGVIHARDAYPQLHDRLATSPFDPHYFYQDSWAAQRIGELRPAGHVDVGSRVDLAGFLTSITDVTFVDIRPLEANLEGLTSVAGSILQLPFEERSLESVSCLHVAEHIGLGRYGDPLDPEGTRRAAAELARVLAPAGHLYFSLPVGRARTEFNAHRIHDPREILEMFPDLTLVEFAGVDDDGNFRRNRDIGELVGSFYACGMFHFRR